MENMTSNDKAFFAWTRQTCINHPDILEHMLKSTSSLERAIAVRIIKNAAGVSDVQNARRSLPDECGHFSSSFSPSDGEKYEIY